ncbi:calcium-binding protein, partial [Desulfobulbus sp.]|uniref:calcium-binding protein n=1 Tax=Desulfobulbus sp. TaxID=895 RepID=UPI00286EE5D7
ADLRLEQSGSYDLVVKINDDGGQLTLKDWFYNPVYRVGTFEFADGTVLTWQELLNRLPVWGGSGNDSLMGNNNVDDTLWGLEGNDTLDGGTGNDTLIGGAGDDTLRGSDGNDTLEGGTGNDNLGGGDGNDVLIGGAGNDTLYGGSGDDRFVFNLGDGQDIIQFDTSGGVDTLAFGEGIELNDIRLVRSGANLLVQVGEDGDQVTLTDWYRGYSESYRVDKFSFADGTVLTWQELHSRLPVQGSSGDEYVGGNNGINDILWGLEGNDTLDGGTGNDVLDGGVGDDTLNGGTGNDTYLFGRGYGSDTIIENDATAGNTDVARFLADITEDQLWFARVGNNLEVSVIGTTDTLNIRNWYAGSQYHVEQFQTANNKVLLNSQVDALVSAMASFTPPASGQTTLPPEHQAALAPVLAANWQ